MLLKNLSLDYLNNNLIDEYEQEIRAKAHEEIGNQMIFDICELLRERIADLNDSVVAKYKGILEEEEKKKAESEAPKLFDMSEALTFTPVTKETFATWCEDFMQEMKQQEDA